MKAIKKPVTIDFFTWDEVVKMGIAASPDTVHGEGENARAWSFMFHDKPLTLENDSCYVIPILEGNMHFTPEDVLIIDVKGEVYPCKKDIFEMTYNIGSGDGGESSHGPFGLLHLGRGTFGQATEAAKQGFRVARTGWNGQKMFAYIVPAAAYPAQTGAAKRYFGEGAMVPYRAYWALKTAQEDVATWTPSGSDTLAEDWVILD